MLNHDLIQAAAPNDEVLRVKLEQLVEHWNEDNPDARVMDFAAVRANGGDCVVGSLLVTYERSGP